MWVRNSKNINKIIFDNYAKLVTEHSLLPNVSSNNMEMWV